MTDASPIDRKHLVFRLRELRKWHASEHERTGDKLEAGSADGVDEVLRMLGEVE